MPLNAEYNFNLIVKTYNITMFLWNFVFINLSKCLSFWICQKFDAEKKAKIALTKKQAQENYLLAKEAEAEAKRVLQEVEDKEAQIRLNEKNEHDAQAAARTFSLQWF